MTSRIRFQGYLQMDIDIGRKLDKGNELLIDIKGDTSGIRKGIDNLNSKFDSLITEQIDFNKGIRDHNLRLDKILEKLAQK